MGIENSVQRVDVWDNGRSNRLGSVYTLANFTYTRKLNASGPFSWEMPIDVDNIVERSVEIDVYSSPNSLVCQGIVKDIKLTLAANGQNILSVSGYDQLIELNQTSVEELTLSDVTTGPADIIALGLGGNWTITNGSTNTNVSYQFEHQSVLSSLNLLAFHTGEYFRLGSDRDVEWINSFTSTDLVIHNNIEPVHLRRNENAGLAVSIRKDRVDYDQVNRIYCFTGDDLSINSATLWPDGTAISTNPHTIGSYTYSIDTSKYYVQNDTLEALESFHKRVDYSDIKSLNLGTLADDQRAANLLLASAIGDLDKKALAQTYYYLGVVGEFEFPQVGDVIKLDIGEYRFDGAVVRISADVYVVESGIKFDSRTTEYTLVCVDSIIPDTPPTGDKFLVELYRQLEGVTR